jgi:hypothetical protein
MYSVGRDIAVIPENLDVIMELVSSDIPDIRVQNARLNLHELIRTHRAGQVCVAITRYPLIFIPEIPCSNLFHLLLTEVPVT